MVLGFLRAGRAAVKSSIGKSSTGTALSGLSKVNPLGVLLFFLIGFTILGILGTALISGYLLMALQVIQLIPINIRDFILIPFNFLYGDSGAIMLIIFIIFIVGWFITKTFSPTLGKYTRIFFTLTYILLSVVFIADNELSNNPVEVQENIEQTGQQAGNLWNRITLPFICAGEAGNPTTERCIEYYGGSEAELDEQQRITIDTDYFYEQRVFELENANEAIPFSYIFDSPVDITLEKFECFSNNNPEQPFYSENFDSNLVINGERIIEVECKNIHEAMTENNQQVQIYTELYYTVESSYLQEVPVINCNNDIILNELDRARQDCISLSWDDIRDLDPNLRPFNENPRGGNSINLDTQSFSRNLPIRIGDGEIDSKRLYLILREREDVYTLGELREISIKDIVIPNILTIENEEERNELNTFLESNSDEEVRFSLRLIENEGAFIGQNDIGFITSLEIDTIARLTKRSTSPSMTFIADYHFGENTEEE